MTVDTTAATPSREACPTRDAPDSGCIYHKDTDVVLSKTAYWIEDDLHVISSTEFDLIAVDETESLAVTQFVDEAYALCRALLDRTQRGEATPQERELAGRLFEWRLGVRSSDGEEVAIRVGYGKNVEKNVGKLREPARQAFRT